MVLVVRTRLLLALLFFSLGVLLLHQQSFEQPIQSNWQGSEKIILYPINADGRQDTQLFLDSLLLGHFEEIEHFFSAQAARYDLSLERPLQVELAAVVSSKPPEVNFDASWLEGLLWSLRMRWWLLWSSDYSDQHIQVFLNYHSHLNRAALPHSLGLQKGRLGIVNAVASIDYQATNNMITAHEILHTLGASDKYDVETLQPRWPDGYAQPYQQPLLPQYQAELMAGRLAQSPVFSLMPSSLAQCQIGVQSATEIGWIRINN